MALHAQKKGKTAEREVINRIIQPIVDTVCRELSIVDIPVIARNLQQSDSGGFDLIGLPWYAIEVKRCETLQLARWWAQTTRQASKNQVPLLIYRQNRKKWRVQMPCFVPYFGGGGVWIKSDIDLQDFERWFENDLKKRMIGLRHELKHG